jgi:hypothetical protein
MRRLNEGIVGDDAYRQGSRMLLALWVERQVRGMAALELCVMKLMAKLRPGPT